MAEVNTDRTKNGQNYNLGIQIQDFARDEVELKLIVRVEEQDFGMWIKSFLPARGRRVTV